MPLASLTLAEPAPLARHVVVIVNRRAGQVLQAGRPSFERRLRDGFARNGMSVAPVFAKGRQIGKALEQADAQAPDLIVLAGGDGTVSQTLAQLAACTAPTAILPLGTLNLLGRDLGLTGNLDADIDAICTGERKAVSLARVNGRCFHSIAGFGLLSTMARERENARRTIPFSRLLGFAAAALRTLFTYRPIEVEFGEGEGSRRFIADTVLVTSNHFDGVPWRRARLDEGRLEVHLLEAGGISARLRLLWLTARGRWRQHDRLTSFPAGRFTVRRRKKRSVSLAVDGESIRLHGPVVFDIAPQTLYLHAKRDD